MKDKHFTCTSCGNPCTHTTTRYAVGKKEFLTKEDALCTKCLEQKKEMWQNLSQLDATELQNLIASLE